MATNTKFDFDRKLSSFSVGTWLKFILFSLFGVFSFFINFPLPEYQINIGPWQWGMVKAQSNVLCSHLTNFVKAAFYTGNFNFMPVVVWAIGLFAVIDVLFLRPQKAWKDKITSAFSIFKIIGFVMLCMNIVDIYFGVHFGFMNWMFNPVASLNDNSIANFVMANILVTICISIPVASLFLPFLVDYGLVDFIGVFVRLIMRPIFKLPGRAAIIMVTAFLGNFSAGHLAVNNYYQTGRFTERESVCIDTSLSTVSVGFLLALATNTGLVNTELWGRSYWNTYFWVAFLITLLVALIGIRIPPLRNIPDTYYEGVEPNPEKIIKKGLIRAAFTEALEIVENQESLIKRIGYIEKETLYVLGTVSAGTHHSLAGLHLLALLPDLRIHRSGADHRLHRRHDFLRGGHRACPAGIRRCLEHAASVHAGCAARHLHHFPGLLCALLHGHRGSREILASVPDLAGAHDPLHPHYRHFCCAAVPRKHDRLIWFFGSRVRKSTLLLCVFCEL